MDNDDMETESSSLGKNIDFESEKDCPRCTQPQGSNPDCDKCAKTAGWSSQERNKLLEERRALDRKFIKRSSRK